MTSTEIEKFDSLTDALAWVQANLPHVGKGSTNPAFKSKYADLADVSKAILPLTGRAGLAWTTVPTFRDGQYVLVGTMSHGSGGTIEAVWPLPEGTAQQVGSSISYGRRYMLMCVTGVAADDDDDGNAAAQAPARQQQRRPEPPAPRAEEFSAAVEAAFEQGDTDKLRAMMSRAVAEGEYHLTPTTQVTDRITGEVMVGPRLIQATLARLEQDRAAETPVKPEPKMTRVRPGDPDLQADQWQRDVEGVLV